MDWMKRIIACHKAVTDQVSHFRRLKSRRYFVWQEDGSSCLIADGKRAERAVTGTTDLFTQMEDDPWVAAFESSLDSTTGVTWQLNSIQYEPDTGMIHYEWTWEVL